MQKSFEQMKREVLNNFSQDELFKTSILNLPELWKTDLYKFCEQMPKGADLHVHGGALTPAKCLIDFIKSRDDILFDTNPNHFGYLLLKNKNPGDSYMPLQSAIDKKITTVEKLSKIWSLAGCPVNVSTWDYFQTLFDMHNDLNEAGPTCKDYFKFSYEYYCKQNIFHMEQRLFLKNSEEEAFQKAHCALDAYLEVKKQYPEFTVKVITVGLKHPVFDKKITENIFQNTAIMNKRIKDDGEDFVIGIDLVNEEDTSRKIQDFENLIKQTLKDAPNLKVILHAGESRNPKNCEIASALALGSKRIGHGLNLWAHPELKSEIINKNICLEVCPVSNQSLGFCDDLRNHPARQYFREGIPIALCSDDPTYQEHSTLSDDFFSAILAWELSIDDVRQLTFNSIKYSSLSENLKQQKLQKLKTQWTRFLIQ